MKILPVELSISNHMLYRSLNGFIIKNFLNSLLCSMKSKCLKPDDSVGNSHLKADSRTKASNLSPKHSKSIVRMQTSSKVYYTTLVKKQHGFHWKHKQTHYQQCLLVAYQKVGEVHLGYIIKTGGLPVIQNFQQVIQNSLPIIKCRDIQSISDKEIALFFHENEEKNEWKFKFYEKEIKEKWTLLLMVLAYQKEFNKSIIQIFHQDMLVTLSKLPSNDYRAQNEFQTAQCYSLDQNNGILQNIDNEAQAKLVQRLSEKAKMDKLCQSLRMKIDEVQNSKLMLASQNLKMKERIALLQSKISSNQVGLNKISEYWVAVSKQKTLFAEQKRKYAQRISFLEQGQEIEQFQILSQVCEQNQEISLENIQKNISRAEQQEESYLRLLGSQIKHLKQATGLFVAEFVKNADQSTRKSFKND